MTQARGAHGQLLKTELPESAYGTDPASMHCVKLPFNSFGARSTRNLITPATIQGRRDPVQPSQGRVDVTGSVVVPVDECAIGYWLEMLMGTPTTTITGSAYQHVFQVNSVLNSYAMEQGFTDLGLYQKITGAKVGGATIRVGGDEELTMSFDMVGRTDVAGAATMSGATQTLSLTRFNNFDAQLREGGSALDAKVADLEMTINNNLDTGIYTISSGMTGTRGDLPEGQCNVTGRYRIMFENWSYYLLALSGTERSLELKFQTGSFFLEFVLNELLYERNAPAIETPAGVWVDMPFQAFFDNASPDETVIQATLVNTWAAYSGHLG